MGVEPLGGDLAVLVTGYTENIEERAGLVRFPAGDGPPCWMPVEPLFAPYGMQPGPIGGGRIILGQASAPAPTLVLGDGVGGCVDDP